MGSVLMWMVTPSLVSTRSASKWSEALSRGEIFFSTVREPLVDPVASTVYWFCQLSSVVMSVSLTYHFILASEELATGFGQLPSAA